MRKGKHKMLFSAFKDDFFLFDLEKDPYEHHNLAGDLPEKLEELKADYLNWSKGTIPAKWQDPHIENVKKEEAKRQSFIDKASSGEQ